MRIIALATEPLGLKSILPDRASSQEELLYPLSMGEFGALPGMHGREGDIPSGVSPFFRPEGLLSNPYQTRINDAVWGVRASAALGIDPMVGCTQWSSIDGMA